MSALDDFLRTYGGAGRPTFEVELPADHSSLLDGEETPFVIIRCGNRTIVVNPIRTHTDRGDGGPVVSVDLHTWVDGEPSPGARVRGFPRDGGRADELPARYDLTAVIVGETDRT